jgi:hypothetical protein
MASTSSFFDSTSPFVTYATSATRGVLINLLRLTAATCHATLNDAIRIYFDGTNLSQKTIGFKLLLNQYLCISCDEYLSIHQQITDKRLQKSDLNENDMNHYVYCTMQKIMSQNDGYKHLNCVFDGVMKFCSFQFEHVFGLISSEGFTIGSSVNNRGGNFSMAELNLLRYILQNQLDRINTTSQNLYIDNDKYKNSRLKCEENDSCQLKIEDEKQRLQQQDEIIRQEAQNCKH